MNKEQVINRLKDLILERKSFITGDYYDEAYKKDVQALEYAIKELERTAQEVPVQEQSNDFDNLPIISSDKLIIHGQVVD